MTASPARAQQSITADAADDIIDLLTDVMQSHADRMSSDYNECDKTPCNWCERAAKIAVNLTAAKPSTQHPDQALRKIAREASKRLGVYIKGCDEEMCAISYEILDDIVLAALKSVAPSDGQEKMWKAFLDWIRHNCKVIYWPSSRAYPVEHAPHAGEDSWHIILDANSAAALSSSETPQGETTKGEKLLAHDNA